jgi:hypothetical protein
VFRIRREGLGNRSLGFRIRREGLGNRSLGFRIRREGLENRSLGFRIRREGLENRSLGFRIRGLWFGAHRERRHGGHVTGEEIFPTRHQHPCVALRDLLRAQLFFVGASGIRAA